MGSALPAFLLTLVSVCLPVLAQDAQSSDPKQRVRAVRDMAKMGSGAIEKLKPFLSDPVQDVRVETVKSIIEIGTQYSLDPLIRATRDNDSEVQIRATDGLVNFYVPGYIKTGLSASLSKVGRFVKGRWTDVNDLMIGPYVQVRPEVIEALGKLARGGASMDARANGARAVGILRGKAATPDLIEALRSKDDQTIYESLVAIRKIGDPSVAPRISFLLRDFNDKVAIAALETTGLLRNRETLPQLKEALDRARNTKVKRAAITALAMMPDPSSRPVYEQFINDKDDGLRGAAAEGFARLNDPAVLPMIEQKFNEEKKMSPRLSLAFAMVMLGKTEVSELSPLQYLVNTLNSSSWRGVSHAFLVELTRNPVVRKPVQDHLRAATKDEKVELSQILAVSGDKETIQYIEPLTRDPDSDVSEQAINALRTLKSRF